MAERHGLKVLLNDPPKKIGVSIDEIAQNCDIITFHTPLTFNCQLSTVNYPTYHLCDEQFLAKTKPNALIINAARGGIVDEQALLRSGRPFIIDTCENEPNLDKHVLQRAMLASMHIAGYSLQGKRNASQMCLNAISETFGLKRIELSKDIRPAGDSAKGWLKRVSDALKAHPEQFEQLRKDYPLR